MDEKVLVNGISSVINALDNVSVCGYQNVAIMAACGRELRSILASLTQPADEQSPGD